MPVQKSLETYWRHHVYVVYDRGLGKWQRDKWISLNFRFCWANPLQKVYGCRIAVVVSRRCSLCWVSKVGTVESRWPGRLSVCSYNASRRGGWSLCLVQIVGGAIRSVCRRNWRQTMMWAYCLQRLDDRCPGLCSPWLTGGIDVASKCWC